MRAVCGIEAPIEPCGSTAVDFIVAGAYEVDADQIDA